MDEGESTDGEAWSVALDEARQWLERMGDRTYPTASEAFALWLKAAPRNADALATACTENLRRLLRPR